jgi:hypothetical protein
MATTRFAAQPIPTEGEHIAYDRETRDFALYSNGALCGFYATRDDAESAARRARYAALTVETHGVSDPDLRGEEITREEIAREELASAIETEANAEIAEFLTGVDRFLALDPADFDDDESAALAIDDGDDDGDGPPDLVAALAAAKAHETISELLRECDEADFDDVWNRALEASVIAKRAAEKAGIDWDWRFGGNLVETVRGRMKRQLA